MSEQIIDKYNIYMEGEKEFSKNTKEAYLRDIMQFNNFLMENNKGNLTNANQTTIITYMMDLQKEGRAMSTISRSLASIRSLYQYLLNNGLINQDPTLNLKAPKTERKIPDILTVEEVDILLAQPKGEDFKGSRDRAMLELLYATGLKVSELLDLDIGDIILDLGIVRLEDQDRVIPIGQLALGSLKFYIENHRKDSSNKNPVFINFSGGRLTRQGFWKIIKGYTKKSNINKSITPQTLRHSLAVHLLENGANIKTVQEILGHSDISTTQVYSIFANTKGNLREEYNRSHPRA